MRASRHPFPARKVASLLVVACILTVTGGQQMSSAYATQPSVFVATKSAPRHVGRSNMPVRALIARIGRSLPWRPSVSRRTEAVSRSVSDAAKFKLPQSTWPSNATKFTSSQLSGGALDDANKNLFANGNLFHRQAYGTHGVLGGYDENAQISFGRYDNYVYSEWLGTYYSTPQFATSRVDDAVATLTSQNVRGQPCYLDNAPNCHLFIWASGLGQNDFAYLVYAVWSNDNAVGEVAFLSSPRSMLPNQAELGRDLQTLLNQGSASLVTAGATVSSGPAVISTPPPAPAIIIDKVNVLHIVRGRYKSTRKLHVNETTTFLAYFHMSSVGTYDATGHLSFFFPKSTIDMSKSGQSIYTGKPQLQVTPSGVFYFNHDGTFTDTSAEGKVTERFTVSLGGAQDSKTVDLTVGQPLGTTLRL